MLTIKEYKDFRIYSKGADAGITLLNNDLSSAGVGYSVGNGVLLGTFTGYVDDSSNDLLYIFKFAKTLIYNNKNYVYGSIAEGYFTTAAPASYSSVSETQLKSAVQNMLDNNAIIFLNNALCAAVIEECTKNGIAVSSEKRKMLYDLQTRAVKRNDFVIENKNYYSSSQTGNFDSSFDALNRFMITPGIGSLTVIVLVIVGLVITSIAAVLLYKYYYPESVVDLKYSDSLTADLDKYLPANVKAELYKQNAQFIKTANRAIENSKTGILGKIGTGAKAVAYVAAGFLLVKFASKYVTTPDGKKIKVQ
jgi:hypothetical protein